MITKFEVGKKYIHVNGRDDGISYTCTGSTRQGSYILEYNHPSTGIQEFIANKNVVRYYEEHVESKKGWVNIYNSSYGILHSTRESADRSAQASPREACIEITWKPGDGLSRPQASPSQRI